MNHDVAHLGTFVDARYGKALREDERSSSGMFDVFGSSGIVGKHTSRVTAGPTIIVGRKGSVGALTFAPNGGWPIDTAYYLEWKNGVAGDWRYLFHALSAADLARHEITTSIPGLNRDRLLETPIKFPVFAEQCRIAGRLDKADAIRRKHRDALKLADEFLRSVFLDMFGDPVTNSKGWDDLPIKEIATVTTGNTPSRQVLDYFGDHIEWIKSDNINTSNHHLTKATEGLSQIGLEVGRSAPAGSTLVTCIAGSPACIGNAALSDRRVAFNQQINALTPKPGIEPEFLYAVTLFSKVRIQAASTNGMKGMVSKGALEQVHFILPSKPERLAFVRIFEKVLTTLRKMHVASEEADRLFKSLQQQAFS